MSYQSILVQLTSDRTCINRLGFAKRVAGLTKKRITGCYFQSEIVPVKQQTSELMISPDGIAWTPGLSEDAQILVEKDEHSVRQLLDKYTYEDEIEYLNASRDLQSDLNNVALTYELVVLSKSYYDGINTRKIEDTLPDLNNPLSSPLFILSENVVEGYYPKNPLIIWNGATESAKTVKDALPMLKSTGQCSVLAYSTDNEEQQTTELDELTALLTCHGVSVNAIHTVDEKKDLTSTINGATARNHHDVIVFGYGGESLMQKLFGESMLNNILSDTNLPLFLSN